MLGSACPLEDMSRHLQMLLLWLDLNPHGVYLLDSGMHGS